MKIWGRTDYNVPAVIILIATAVVVVGSLMGW